MKQSELTHFMTSLVPGLGNDICIFWQLWRDKKITLRAGPERKFENYESVQHRLQFSGIKKGAKISFHRHFKSLWFEELFDGLVWTAVLTLLRLSITCEL